jgi:FkbM family methyltransferase
MHLRGWAKRWLYGSCPGIAGGFPYFGTRVYFPRGATVFKAACEQGIYEGEIVSRLRCFVRPNSTFLDVGANIGLMAIPVLQSCPSCSVVSFEPSPTSLPFLRKTAAGSAYTSRWTIIGKALSNRTGTAEFFVGGPKHDLFEGLKSGARIEKSACVDVPVSTVDREWAGLGKPDVSVMKIDVEGAEALVLQGAPELLKVCRPYVVLEWYAPFLQAFETDPESLLEIAAEWDYRLFTIPSGVPVADHASLRVQMVAVVNYVLAP